MSEALLKLIQMLNDESRPAWERTHAGRTAMAKIQRRIKEIDEQDLERAKRKIAREADAFARAARGEA